MSKAFGKILFEKLNEEAREVLASSSFYVRYLKTEGVFVFNVPMYDSIENESNESGESGELGVVCRKIKVSLSCLEYMCSVSGVNSYFDKETGEVYKYKFSGEEEFVQKEFGHVFEDFGLCLDEWYDLCIAQYLCCVNKKTLEEARRKEHSRRLGRVDTAWYELKKVVLEPKRGRPVGSGGLKEADWETKMFNVANYTTLVEKFVRKDFYTEFMWLEKDRCDVYHEKFVAGKSKLVWKILRYKWKLSSGLCEENKEFEKDLKEKCEKYKLKYDSVMLEAC